MRQTVCMLLLSTVLLSACGFHLRGKIDLPPSLETIRITSPDGDLRTYLADALDFSGATVTGSDDGALLDVVDVRFERRVRTVDTRGLATSYMLHYAVDFRVEDASGASLLDSATINLKRDFNFDSTQVLEKEDEEQFLRDDMRRAAAQRIVRRIGTVSATQANSTPSAETQGAVEPAY
ncbi:MAG: LPS assembly lipoprotein LptE [Gammaproteobacteria bacterium]|nr:LPS assembly lipoprotein LptE [Gammaproteobacteria bacterium]